MSSRRHPRNAPRGGTLLLVLVLLAVLSVIGVAAVSLGSAERTNAALKTHQDRLVACAQAAQASVWSEMLRYGPGYLGSPQPIPDLTLPDGTVLRGGHYRQTTGIVAKASARAVPCKSQQVEEFMDITNRDSFFSVAGGCFVIFARCVDSQGREMEVEFGLNKIL